MARVLQIMPELQACCGEPTSPLSMMLLKKMGQVVSLSNEVVKVAGGGLDVSIALSPVAIGQVGPVGVEIDELMH
ncbi:hypothetical protein D1007_54486 [Hordeum vulgare]|nr:hypothetical protein D1007_54486 [Hordeum vulgare]